MSAEGLRLYVNAFWNVPVVVMTAAVALESFDFVDLVLAAG